MCATPSPWCMRDRRTSLWTARSTGAPAGHRLHVRLDGHGAQRRTLDLLDQPVRTVPPRHLTVPEEVDEDNDVRIPVDRLVPRMRIDATAAVTVKVLNLGSIALDVACIRPPLVYEGSEDFALDCSALRGYCGFRLPIIRTGRGQPEARTANTDLLTSRHGRSYPDVCGAGCSWTRRRHTSTC